MSNLPDIEKFAQLLQQCAQHKRESNRESQRSSYQGSRSGSASRQAIVNYLMKKSQRASGHGQYSAYNQKLESHPSRLHDSASYLTGGKHDYQRRSLRRNDLSAMHDYDRRSLRRGELSAMHDYDRPSRKRIALSAMRALPDRYSRRKQSALERYESHLRPNERHQSGLESKLRRLAALYGRD